MIPDPEALARAYEVLATELGVPSRHSAIAIRLAMREADHLADDTYDVPAALLYSLGKTPRCFAGFRCMSVLIVEWYTHVLGFKLTASCNELCDVLLGVACSRLSYDDVKGWMFDRLLPFGG